MTTMRPLSLFTVLLTMLVVSTSTPAAAKSPQLCDLTGKWAAQYYHAQGLYLDLVTFRMSGRDFTSTKSESHPWLKAGSKWFKGAVKPGGFADFQMQQSSGWVDVPVKINDACDVIELSTVNGGVELQKIKTVAAKPVSQRKPVAAKTAVQGSQTAKTTAKKRPSPSPAGNRRLTTAEIYKVFKGRTISNFLGFWEIDFLRNRRWDGTMKREILTEGTGKWGSKKNLLCVKTSNIETTEHYGVEDIHGCFYVWLDFSTGDLTMGVRKRNAKPILIEKGVFLEGEQSSLNDEKARLSSKKTRLNEEKGRAKRNRTSTTNRRLTNEEIIEVFSDRHIANYWSDWRIDFNRNRKWNGVITSWNQGDGYGTWTAKGDMHCLKITDVEARGYELLDGANGCYQIWLDSESGDLTMIAPKKSAKPILIGQSVFLDDKPTSAK